MQTKKRPFLDVHPAQEKIEEEAVVNHPEPFASELSEGAVATPASSGVV